MSQFRKMNPVVKAKWLIDLRSGEYRQGKGCLKKFDSEQVYHCCLGILGEQAAREGACEVTKDGGYGRFDGYSSLPPRSVELWAQLNLQAINKLSNMNDSIINPNDFLTIADWIEENL